MDRLVCGDVGYGKTEVAMRAAFKAVEDNRQVAVLVPTTLLAHQHYDNFAERFAPFPTRVALLSRFQSPKEAKAILKEIAAGSIDVVIGTHRLLQKDVQFRNLGLVIIDEEQWFGVKHKERLKELRTQVDVLTLTATPIPRTLQMAMASVRDLSIIDTAAGRPVVHPHPSRPLERQDSFGKPFSASSVAAARCTLFITGWRPWNAPALGCSRLFRKRGSSWRMGR